MRKSESIKEIAKAIQGMQASPIVIGVNASGYGYDYATLDKVISRIMPIATTYGLSVTQPLGEVNGEPVIHTLLMHISGEWMESSYPLEKAGIGKANDAQQFGAAVTYARRYGLLSLFGVPVGKDDDANSLTQKPKAQRPAGQKYGKDDPTPSQSIINGLGDIEDIEQLTAYYKKHRQLINDSPNKPQIEAEFAIRKGQLEGVAT